MTESFLSPAAAVAQPMQSIDPHLLPFLLAAEERRADELLAALLEHHALPIIERIAGRGVEAEDLRSEVLTKLIALLRECKAAPHRKSITNFSHYVSVLTANVCREEQRRLHPRRRSLKDALRHTLTQELQLALWQTEQTQVCGLAQWQTAPARHSERLQLLQHQPQMFLTTLRRDVTQLTRAELLLALFQWLGHPLVFDDLVTIVAQLQGIKDDQPVAGFLRDEGEEDPLVNLPMPGPRPDDEAEWRAFLSRLWREIEQLPPLQRQAYLLNFTDGEIEWFWFYGIASLRRIGATLCLTAEQFQRAWTLLDWREAERQQARELRAYDEQFALLWQQLPLNDLTIAALLETSRQNVINLRQAARRRLRRKMLERMAISPAASRQSE